jgi:predicted GNAT family N-acyltransferase
MIKKKIFLEMLVSVLPWSEARTDAQLVRRFVFIEEQQIPESLELDEAGDSQCWHAIARDGNEPVGTGRLFPDGHVGRMAVVKSHRSKGVGGLILNALIARAREQKIQFVRLGAQVSAEKFYLGHKFVREGDPYVHPQVPIEHVSKAKETSECLLKKSIGRHGSASGKRLS